MEKTTDNVTDQKYLPTFTCSKLTINTRTGRVLCSSYTGLILVSIVNFEHILHFVLMFLLLTLSSEIAAQKKKKKKKENLKIRD